MIHFVGAGSGAVDLITIRGAELLKEADVIIYAGSLVNPDLLNYAKESCEIYDSAKMTLDEVLEKMFEAEKENKMTVRLHTGDSSIYGAIREQMDRLDEEGISYDVCPGVPDVSQSVIITRMAGRTPVPEKESIASFAEHGATMVIFLSTGLLKELSKELVKGRYTEDTPAAIVYKATWPDEKIMHCTVGTLYETAQENNITKTALIIVGDVLDSEYSLSRLYADDFSTEFRQAKK